MDPAETNRRKAEEFLARNINEPDVNALEGGMQFKVLKEATGRQPGATDTVTVHYRGTSLDGREFDSSYRRGQPATFRVNQVILGWRVALQEMHEGETWKLFIPPDMAYGERGAPPDIGPNELLIFEVELLKVG